MPKSRMGRAPSSLSTMVVLLMGIAMMISACGSSSSKDSDGSGTDARTNAGVAEAKSFVAANDPDKVDIPQLAELSKRPAADKLAVFINSGSPVTVVIANAYAAAAKTFGWEVRLLNAQNTAEGLQNAWSTAVRLKPDTLAWDSTPREQIEKYLTPLTENRTILTGMAVPGTVGDGMVTIVGGTPDFAARGQNLARWIVADSNGKANVAMFGVPVPVINTLTESFTAELKRLCSSCESAVEDVNPTGIGSTIPTEIVNYLLAHPDVNYVAGGFGDITQGLSQALKTAGLSEKVKIVNQSGSANLASVAAGQEAMDMPEPDGLVGWLLIDAAARTMVGDSLEQKNYLTLPLPYMTKAKAEPFVKTGWNPANYEQKFKALWGG